MRKNVMKRALTPAACAFVLLLFGGESASACSCAGQPSPGEAYAEASAVFVWYVERVTPARATSAEDEYAGAQTAYVRVEETFKGVRAGGRVVLKQPGHNCAPKYAPGERLLMYAGFHQKGRTWEVYGCGRSSPVESAADDLLYLRALPASARRTRLSGTIVHYEDTPEKLFLPVAFLAATRVRITGAGGSYEVHTNANGVYELYDVPPGEYAIEPDIPAGLKVRFPMPFGEVTAGAGKALTIKLGTRGTAGSDFILGADISITGRVLGAGGKPLPDVCLDLKPTGAQTNPYFRVFDCTEADGSYELDDMPPGEYVIVVNADGEPSGSEPFGTVYYPGVTEREKATTVKVTAGDRLKGRDIRIPLATADEHDQRRAALRRRAIRRGRTHRAQRRRAGRRVRAGVARVRGHRGAQGAVPGCW